MVGAQKTACEVISSQAVIHLLESRFGGFNEFCKSSSVVDSQISQDLTVEFDTSFRQAADETAVAQAISTGCSIDTGNPELTEFAFLGSSVTASVAQRLS